MGVVAGLRRVSGEWRAWRGFSALPPAQRAVVFYSEGPGYVPHLEPIVDHLLAAGQPVAYLTSSAADPILRGERAGLRAFAIGSGAVRTYAFTMLQARIVVMTMPDLQTFHIKRAPGVRRYAYVHHSIVSTHMVYRPAAFDHFDAIFCVGPHHVAETRARERVAGLAPKALVEHGYGRLDTLIEENARTPSAARAEGPARVVVAPSWGPTGLLERHGAACILPLLEAGLDVTLRPHPRTRQMRPGVLEDVVARVPGGARFRVEEDVASTSSLVESDLMVSDWSGAALEYAFSRLKPVLFVDVPRKVNNPGYEALGIEPLEAALRARIGAVLPEAELGALGATAKAIVARDARDAIAAAREQTIFNLGHSGRAGAEALLRMLREDAGGTVP